MPTTFQARVATYLGSGYTETTGLSENLMAGAKYIIDLLPENKLDEYATNLTDSGTGAVVTGHRTYRAHKDGYRASRIDPGLKTQATPSSGSIYEPSIIDPVWYVENGKGYVLPGGGIITGMPYPTITYLDTSISNFPTSLEHGPVLFAVIQGCLDIINDSRVFLEALTYVAPTAPTAPTDFSLSVNAVIPTAPADSAYSYTDAVLGAYTATTIGSLGVVPTYTKPTIGLITQKAGAFNIGTSYTITAVGTTDFTLIGAASNAVGIVFTATGIGAGTGTAISNNINAPNAFTLVATAPIAPVDSAYNYTDAVLGTYTATTIGLLGTAPTYTKPTTTFSVTNAATYIQTNEDLEKGQAELQIQNALLEQYGKDLNNELNEFNKETEIYRSTVQNAIRQAELDQERLMLNANKTTDLSIQNKAQTINKDISLYKDKLQKFASQIDLFRSQVESELQVYRTNLERWQTQRATELQQYNSDIQNEINEYQKELAIYQSTVQNAIRQAELDQERLMLTAGKTTDLSIQNKAQTLNKDISLYKDKLEKFAGQINLFRAIVDSEIQTYQQKLNKYQGQIQVYNAQIQDAQTKYNLDQQKYQSGINNFTLILNGAKKEYEDFLKGRL